MSKQQQQQQERKPRYEPGQVSYPEVLNAEDMKCYGESIAVCQKRKLVAAVLTKKALDQDGYVTFFRYHPKPASSSSSSSTTTSSATAASASSSTNNNNNGKTSSSCLSSLDYTFEKLSAVFVSPKPWELIFGDRYLFFLGDLENRVAVIDLNVATSDSEEERKKAKVEFSSFAFPASYSCEYSYGPVLNTSLTKLAFVAMSFVGSSSDFNGVVILDVSKSYNNNNNNKEEEENVPEEDAFPTISAIMDEHDEKSQAATEAQFSINDDGARIAYISEYRLKVCDVATKEKTFEVDVTDLDTRGSCICRFHPREANTVLFCFGRKVHFYDVKVTKAKLREFDLGCSETAPGAICFPSLASQSRYLLASLSDKTETPGEHKNYRLNVIDTLDGTVIQSTSMRQKSNVAASNPSGGFLSHNTMLFSDSELGACLLRGVAVCAWPARRAVFLIREKSASSNRIGKVLFEEWVVLVLCAKYVA